MAKFADTAAYFETRAKKARSDKYRQRLFETARFYRMLAQITPTFPSGYKQPEPITSNASRNAKRLYARAEQCRAMAEAMGDNEAALIRLAEAYEQLARSQVGRPARSLPTLLRLVGKHSSG